MKEQGEIKSYFSIHHGRQAWLKDMPPYVEHVVFQLIRSGEAVGQYALPGIRPEGDMRVWMPKRVKERSAIKEAQIARIKEELARAQEI